MTVIMMPHGSPGDPMNSASGDLNRLTQYMRETTGSGLNEIVALEVSTDLVRVYLRGTPPTVAGGFNYPNATMELAGPEHWNRFKKISMPDFSRYLAKAASRQVGGLRSILGDKAPTAEGHSVTFMLTISAPNSAAGAAIASDLNSKQWRGVTKNMARGFDNRAIDFESKFQLSEALLQQVVNETCAIVSQQGGACTSWHMRLDAGALKF